MVNVTQKYIRSGGFAHRVNITAPDVLLIDPAVALTLTTNTTGGSLVAQPYTVAYVGRIDTMGVTNRSASTEITMPPGPATNTITLTLPQLTGCTHYELFCSDQTTSHPLSPYWVGAITEAQRAAGAFIGTYGVVTSPSVLAPAGAVTFGCNGTGLSIADPIFDWSNAFVLPTPTARINCVGKTRADMYVQFEVDDLRQKPDLIAVPFYKTQANDSTFYGGPAVTVASSEMVGGALVQRVCTFDVSACVELLITVGRISGHNAYVNLWVELV